MYFRIVQIGHWIMQTADLGKNGDLGEDTRNFCSEMTFIPSYSMT